MATIEIAELSIDELNSLPLHKRISITNKNQGKSARFACSNCGKVKISSAHISLDDEWLVKSITCSKCFASYMTVKKAGLFRNIRLK